MSKKERHPIVRDIRQYEQTIGRVSDERVSQMHRRTAFLTPEEETWYQEQYDKYREEFGLRPQD